MKSCLFRVHDCLHQLWGLPTPSPAFTEEERYQFKRAQMCGEVAVLTISEFRFADHLWKTFEEIRPLLWSRNALPMLAGPLAGKSTERIAARLDGVLHRGLRPQWLRESPEASAFADDYVPMLERDRADVDRNWELMRKATWVPAGAPTTRYSPLLDGLELTLWMIRDFDHLLDTDPGVDAALVSFNRARRASIVLPEGWGGT